MKLISLFPTEGKPAAGTIDNLYSEFFKHDFPVSFRNGAVRNGPAVNIAETEDDFRIEIAAPGFVKEDFELKVDNELLSIAAKKEKKEELSGKYTRREFGYVAFTRNFHLPESVNPGEITANYENGVLYITLAKKEEAKPQPPKTIKVS